VNVLVTGASGFLGKRVVAKLVEAGHRVRAVVRPGHTDEQLGFAADVEIFRADLRQHPDLASAFTDIDAVVHLAAAMSGSDAVRFSDTMIATERLFDAMAASSVRRLVLCSSFSVYDWLQAHGEIDESLPMRHRPYVDGGYASGKVWQERLAERRSREFDWELTILRPGFVWGDRNPCPDDTYGRSGGGLHLVFGPRRQPALTHVDNCADCFRATLESEAAIGEIINVTDAYPITSWEFLGDHLRGAARSGTRIALPYVLVAAVAWTLQRVSHAIWGEGAKLPSLFAPGSFAEGYRPRTHSRGALQRLLPTHRALGYRNCLALTYPDVFGSESAPSVDSSDASNSSATSAVRVS
jgi:nucleoside-diphosphate-sugar epimerase